MRRKAAIVSIVCLLILPLASCNFLGLPEYELNVTVEAGVLGTPASGKYVYPDLEEIAYEYTPLNEKHSVFVNVDGTGATAKGTITLYRNTVLLVRLFDVRRAWKVTFFTSDSTTGTSMDVTFSGADILAGTFSDSNGKNGTWDAASGKINFNYSNWESYKFTGTLTSMSGTWSNGTKVGTWGATSI